MRIRQIRNATLKIIYGGITFLLDPWLQDKGTGFSAKALRPEMQGVNSPLNDLPFSPEEILKGVDYLLVTHIHPDHFTPEYLPKDIKILAANEKDKSEIKKLGFKNITLIDDKNTHEDLVDIEVAKTPTVHGDNEELALKMGDGSGYLLAGEKESLYIVGDTVLYSAVNRFCYKTN